MADIFKKSDGRFVLMCFVLFFGVIVVVNSIFIYNALQTHSGVVTEQPYKKGLAFNDTLARAKAQPQLKHDVSYEGRVLRWVLPITDASVTAHMIRPVKEGHDFNILLKHVGGGVYEAKPDMPLPGIWTANLRAIWDNKEFRTVHQFIAP